ncbi:MAG TPA: hypothetical protein VGN60_12690 [Devosia sp.]|jgi:hypothetical protein|nr:hypothetical protein [Devosia sp.]
MQTPTTDQLRNRIDQGLTGEKIPMPDPAAAPLGTDAEAGGTPPTTRERQVEANAAPDRAAVARTPPSGILVYLALVVIVACVFTLVAFFALP